jgi:hypothetical protein
LKKSERIQSNILIMSFNLKNRLTRQIQPTPKTGAADLQRVQPIRLRFQQVEVLPWELSVHPGSYNRLMGG